MMVYMYVFGGPASHDKHTDPLYHEAITNTFTGHGSRVLVKHAVVCITYNIHIDKATSSINSTNYD